jgi:uncharacterized Tic20 family protein
MTQAAPGWYADPHDAAAQRWWDGNAWTDHVQRTPAAPAAAAMAPQGRPSADAMQWAMIAHLSALIGLVTGMSFLGPLVVYLVKKDEDPYIREQAAEALNFNLSVLIYGFVLGLATVILLIVLVGLLLIPVLIAGAIAWLILVIMGAVKAGRGEPFRYPLTLRFVN